MRRPLSLQSLERRQLLAADIAAGTSDESALVAEHVPQGNTAGIGNLATFSVDSAEGEAASQAANDLVAFAKAIAAAGVRFYGTDWDESTRAQLDLFDDGAAELPFVNVTDVQRILNQEGILNDITKFPIWIRADRQRLEGVQTLEMLSAFAGVAIPQNDAPSLRPIELIEVPIGSPIHIPIDAYDPNGGPLDVSVTINNANLVSATVLEGNRSAKMDLAGYGSMTFELFEGRAPETTSRFIDLVQSDFYDSANLNDIVDDVAIQTGNAFGNNISENDFIDDEFHTELQHNRSGVLSMVSETDDTKSSRFSITENPLRDRDFQQSVFGQLIEGESVREAISGQLLAPNHSPIFPVVIEDVNIFDDHENALIMFQANSLNTGTTVATITVTDDQGFSASQVTLVRVVADDFDSPPFLAPIQSTPATGSVGVAQTFQISSVDIEGDPVEYSAVALSPFPFGNVSVNENGFVTVTPSSHFEGPVDVRVGVRPADSLDDVDSDTQIVRLTFDSNVASPPSVSLLPNSDSGFSQSDQVTNSGTLFFLVEDLVAGDEVQLWIDGQVAETTIAEGPFEIVSLAASTDLANGSHSIGVSIRRDGVRIIGNTFELIYDSTAPSIDRSSFPSQVTVGESLTTRLSILGTGNGETHFSLLSTIDGMTLSEDGTLRYSPTAQELGPQSIELVVSDQAGNQSVEAFELHVLPNPFAETPLVQIRPLTTDFSGNPITSIEVGQRFLLHVAASDLRTSFLPSGIRSAFADLVFDLEHIRPVDDAAVFGDANFNVGGELHSSGTSVDEMGAHLSSDFDPAPRSAIFASIEMVAVGRGETVVRANPAESSFGQTILDGVHSPISPERIGFGQSNLVINASFHRSDNPSDVNGDGNISASDALVVINVLDRHMGMIDLNDIDFTQTPLKYDVTADGKVSSRDVLSIINVLGRMSQFQAEGESAVQNQAISDFLRDSKERELDFFLETTPKSVVG